MLHAFRRSLQRGSLRRQWGANPPCVSAPHLQGLPGPPPLLQCILQREAATSLGYWGVLMLGAVQTGFCGSLTTVSTFVTEVGEPSS